jgi:hypothetical protein
MFERLRKIIKQVCRFILLLRNEPARWLRYWFGKYYVNFCERIKKEPNWNEPLLVLCLFYELNPVDYYKVEHFSASLFRTLNWWLNYGGSSTTLIFMDVIEPLTNLKVFSFYLLVFTVPLFWYVTYFLLKKDLAPNWQTTLVVWGAFYSSLVVLVLILPETATGDSNMFYVVGFPTSNHTNYLTLSFGAGSLFFLTSAKQKLRLTPTLYFLFYIHQRTYKYVFGRNWAHIYRRTKILFRKFIFTSRVSRQLPSSRLITV